jgi:hypothetical protein
MCKLRQRGRGYGGPGPAGARGIDPSLQPPPAVAASPLRKDPLPHTCPKERNFRLPPEARWDATSPCQVRGLYRTRRQAGLRAATSGSLSARTAPCIQYAPINRAAILEAVPHVAPHEQHGPCEAKGPTEHQWGSKGPTDGSWTNGERGAYFTTRGRSSCCRRREPRAQLHHRRVHERASNASAGIGVQHRSAGPVDGHDTLGPGWRGQVTVGHVRSRGTSDVEG